MSKSGSGLFSGTKGTNASNERRTPSQIKSYSRECVKDWAEKKKSKLTGKTKKNFNTACVAYDESTGKVYYGRNGGYHENGANIKNLHITTIHTTKSQFGNYKESCENCHYAFKGKVKANYSGWKDEE